MRTMENMEVIYKLMNLEVWHCALIEALDGQVNLGRGKYGNVETRYYVYVLSV